MSFSSESVDSSSFLASSHLCSVASRSSEVEYKRHHDEEPKGHRHNIHTNTPSSWSFSRSSWVTLRLYSSSCVSCSENLLFRSLTLSSRSSSAFLDCSHSDETNSHAPLIMYSIMLLGISRISYQSTYKMYYLAPFLPYMVMVTEFNFSFKNGACEMCVAIITSTSSKIR